MNFSTICAKSHFSFVTASRFLSLTRIMGVSKQQIVDKLTQELEPVHLEVEDISDGCGASFSVLVVSEKFKDQKLLLRQRMVNKILAEEMKELHALPQRTLTPEQWTQMSKTQ
ncbi:uncharacterized protein LOC141901825 [Tubulanus polymorphus]|uniref:uncharacterized protein LOC141901825 n=1 Tax=Tubulanus polymorphus TaxID=672921 RepID=UPI003DA646EF